MGIWASIKSAKVAAKLQSEFVRLYETPNAYRPPVSNPEYRQGRGQPITMLHRLADHANSVGLTAGDAGVLAVEMLTSIDQHRSYAAAFDEVVGYVGSGALLTTAGDPMRDYATPEAVAAVLEMVAVAARMEAYGEAIERTFESAFSSDDSSEREGRVRQLQEEYAHLTALALSSDADRAAAIRTELQSLGAEPDEELNARVRRKLGVSPPPWLQD